MVNVDCIKISVPKTRKSPPYKAKDCKGEKKKGKDGNMYVSKKYPSGYRWARVGHKTIAEKRKECKEKGLILDSETKECRKRKNKTTKTTKTTKTIKTIKTTFKQDSDVVKVSTKRFNDEFLNYVDSEKFCFRKRSSGLTTNISKSYIRLHSNTKNTYYYVLYDGEKIRENIVAFALMRNKGKKYSEVKVICARKNSKGYGRRFLTEIEKLESSKTKMLILCSVEEAIPFYYNMNYDIMDDDICWKLRLFFCPGDLKDCLYMYKYI